MPRPSKTTIGLENPVIARSVALPLKLFQRIDNSATRQKLTRSQWIRQVVEASLEVEATDAT
ncbi:MAG: hypothetical protein ACM37W_00315 [Actinomycetota bacterium]